MYDLIKGIDPEISEWQKYIQTAGPQDVILNCDPGVGELSRFELETLLEISRDYTDLDDWEVAEITHHFDEWKKNEQRGDAKSKKIPWDDVLESLGLLESKEFLVKEAIHRQHA